MNYSIIFICILIILLFSIVSGTIAYLLLLKTRKVNKNLQIENSALLRQKEDWNELSCKARQAYDSKLTFFTNISHEFRTPLTLILTPLEELIASSELPYAHKQQLTLIQKNTFRLLKLVNQLIDFRKIELEKMKLRACENDLILFINQAMEAFQELAKKKNIDFRLITKERHLKIWFDPVMMEKVIFNLLFNAFKFTMTNGIIYITVEERNDREEISIKIEDNGVGMEAEAVEHAFDLFYEGSISYEQGFGLGLTLSKELMEAHKGKITLTSKQWKGTCVVIKLYAGTAHLKKEEMIKNHPWQEKMKNDKNIYISEFEEVTYIDEVVTEHTNNSNHSILIIEDNADLRNFLFEKLKNEYEVLLAENGIIGLQKAYGNIPDLILCDVMIPGKDGIMITNILKNDFKTSHIPIILLTSNIRIEQQIEGIKSMADAYMIKPFNLQFLKETIRNVMKNRESLREHYTSEVAVENKGHSLNKLDKKFINEFTAIVESNIGNEDFTVDDICKNIGISRVQLYRKVKALLGLNVNDYIINTRLQKAKYLLKQNDLSISEIAFKVGFSSAAYFSTVFKSKFDLTPKQFKEKNEV